MFICLITHQTLPNVYRFKKTNILDLKKKYISFSAC